MLSLRLLRNQMNDIEIRHYVNAASPYGLRFWFLHPRPDRPQLRILPLNRVPHVRYLSFTVDFRRHVPDVARLWSTTEN